MSAPTLSTGVILQILNPKAYAAHTTFFSGFILYPDNFVAEVLVKLVVMNLLWFSFHFTWLLAGVKLNELNLSAHRQKQINIGMATCLIFVVLISLQSLLNH
jgi:threonine/homoserine/homoserine lactone efflux protein